MCAKNLDRKIKLVEPDPKGGHIRKSDLFKFLDALDPIASLLSQKQQEDTPVKEMIIDDFSDTIDTALSRNVPCHLRTYDICSYCTGRSPHEKEMAQALLKTIDSFRRDVRNFAVCSKDGTTTVYLKNAGQFDKIARINKDNQVELHDMFFRFLKDRPTWDFAFGRFEHEFARLFNEKKRAQDMSL